MYLYSPTLSQFLLKNSFGKVVFKFWSRDCFCGIKICFSWLSFLNNKHFLYVFLNFFIYFFFLIYGCLRCIQIWVKFRTEIPVGKYLKLVGSKWTPGVDPPPLVHIWERWDFMHCILQESYACIHETLSTGGNWQKWKRVFLTCHCHKIYRDEAVGLKSCKNTWKITIFVKMWNLGPYRENLIFCQ